MHIQWHQQNYKLHTPDGSIVYIFKALSTNKAARFLNVVYFRPRSMLTTTAFIRHSFVLNTSDLRKHTSCPFSRPHLDNSHHVGTLTLIRPLIFPVLVKKLNLLTTFKSTLVTFLILDYYCLWTLMTDGFLQEFRTAWDFFHVGKDSLHLKFLLPVVSLILAWHTMIPFLTDWIIVNKTEVAVIADRGKQLKLIGFPFYRLIFLSWHMPSYVTYLCCVK